MNTTSDRFSPSRAVATSVAGSLGWLLFAAMQAYWALGSAMSPDTGDNDFANTLYIVIYRATLPGIILLLANIAVRRRILAITAACMLGVLVIMSVLALWLSGNWPWADHASENIYYGFSLTVAILTAFMLWREARPQPTTFPY